MSNAIIELAGVEVRLDSAAGPVEILRGIDLVIEQGEAFGLIGPSGSGKSTLLMVTAGLEAVTGGEIKVADRMLSRMSEDELAEFRRDNVGIVFQSFHLIATMTALENVAVPLELAGDAQAMDKAASQLERVGLGHRLGHFPAQLSGGEQQRVALARALAAGARIVLADEPTGNLDSATGEAIVDLLFQLKADQGITLLLVTHDENLAARCDRVGELHDGRISGIKVKRTGSNKRIRA
jgi:putative ABC transport system ATP-binding protein